MATAGPIVDDLRAESDDLDGLVAELPAERWAEATPAAGWTIAHQIAHLLWTDRVALLSVHDEAGFNEVLGAAADDPTRVRRPRRGGGRRRRARRVAGRLARDPRPAARRAADGARRPQAAVVRAADERRLDGHRAADGDLGARPRRRRRPRGEAAADGAVRSIAHIGVRTRDFAFAINGHAAPEDPFRVELRRTRRRYLDVGSRGRAAAGDRFGGGLLPAGHPAAASPRPST